MNDRDETMTPAAVAAAFNVDAKTVSRWAKQGKLSSFRTPGGHRRYNRAEVMRLIRESRQERAA